MRINLEINKKKLLVLLGLLTLIFVFIIYRILDNKNIDSLIIPQKYIVDDFDAFILYKTSNSEQKSFFLKTYKYDDKTGYYSLPSNTSESDKHLLRQKLMEIGYYEDFSSADRNVETPGKQLLNGYLGQFFRFKLLGNINWLILPTIVYFLATLKNRKRWEVALLIFYFIASAVVIKGGFNYRYQLTLVPIAIFIIFYYLYEILSRQNLLKYKFLILGFVFLISLFNTVKSFFALKSELAGNSANVTEVKSSTNGNFEDMVNYINTLPIDSSSKVLVNNLPEFFYYSQKEGIYCWFNDDACFTSKGAIDVLRDHTLTELTPFLTSYFGARYILSTETFNAYTIKLQNYLDSYTKLVYKSGDYVLYEIK